MTVSDAITVIRDTMNHTGPEAGRPWVEILQAIWLLGESSATPETEQLFSDMLAFDGTLHFDWCGGRDGPHSRPAEDMYKIFAAQMRNRETTYTLR